MFFVGQYMQWNKNYFRDLIILAFGLIGIAWFFYALPSHHPFSVFSVQYQEAQYIEKADSVFQSWQYQSFEHFSKTEFSTENKLIDSLQKRYGTEHFKKLEEESDFLQHLPLMTWKVRERSTEDQDDEMQLTASFTNTGDIVEISANNTLITHQRPFNRYAIRSVFENKVNNYTRGLEDSLINGLLDYQHISTVARGNSQSFAFIRQLRKLYGVEEYGGFYPMENIWDLTNFYLNKSGWRYLDLSRDSVEFKDEAGIRFARAYISAADSVTDVMVQITLDILPAGSLKSMDYEITPTLKPAGKTFADILDSLSLFIILAFAIWLLFVFYLRIKARAIDTKPAMVVAVLAGFLVPGFGILQFIDQVGLTQGLSDTSNIINGMMLLGVLGAVSAIGFFVITAVSDSITRQYWPQKMKTWDLIRRGLFMNKPVGWGVINAIAIGGFLAGLVSLFLTFIPAAYISADTNLIADTYFLPSLANLMVTICTVLVIVVPTYLILGNQLKAISNRNWVIPILSAILFCLLDFLPLSIEPEGLDRVMRAVIGLTLGYFYLRYDFLTIAFGFFIFINFLTTSKGWIMEGSPDANTFYLFGLVLIFFLVAGIYFIINGRGRKELPEYIPSYIEDQAKEQRLRQELSIARVVQQTFLPSKIHHLPGIDVAGACIPAQETGGDYYDMIPLGDQRTAIAIGDVSGKGIRAAFYMTFTKGVLHSLSALILSPAELLSQLNRLFNENATRGTFISMIYGILEADKREFTFARAGHNPMLLVRSNGNTEWLKPAGIGIGVYKGDDFIKYTEEATLKLKEGDVIILYTDGITEMLNTSNHFYGEERLERLVRGVRNATSENILQIIINDVNEFKGVAKQHDDMTLVIIKADASVNQ